MLGTDRWDVVLSESLHFTSLLPAYTQWCGPPLMPRMREGADWESGCIFAHSNYVTPLVYKPTSIVPAHSQLHQVIHKRLQADIIGKDGLGCLADASVRAGRMRRGGVELRKEETGL